MAAREPLRAPTADDEIAKAHYLTRRLEGSCARLRRAAVDADEEGRAALVAGLAGLVAAAERLLGASR